MHSAVTTVRLVGSCGIAPAGVPLPAKTAGHCLVEQLAALTAIKLRHRAFAAGIDGALMLSSSSPKRPAMAARNLSLPVHRTDQSIALAMHRLHSVIERPQECWIQLL